ncbi:flagellar biosynthesis protein FliQ [Clostridium sp. KNHs216]|jgi:flagellar biosynthetic protein FliQ|uniref:flagellar biosynthesis protein FliQ n=1 Tax=Eubacteriales TaxID=186802 RepID=UPI00056DC6E9|nr:flagellar biosynthesis protein FliQ [Clostridium sp. KNHs216]MBE6831557.1 flagellar biosynthesis protein FliQ [Oscillospiraceae bacterium]TQI65458.1 flagellar biosynthetic protein FliQ [Clostridium sp. KNHs216]
MTTSQITEVIQAAMVAALKLSAPILIASVLLGLIVSIFQAATQIHEQTLTFVPKLVAIALILVILGPWMMETMNDFTIYIFSLITKLN